MVPYRSFSLIQTSWKHRDHKLIWKDVMFTLDTSLRLSEGFNHVFSNYFGISGLLETLITADEL